MNSGVRKGEDAPGARVASPGDKMAFRRTVGRAIPWSGCVPAEPASVSPGGKRLLRKPSPAQCQSRRAAGKVIVVGLGSSRQQNGNSNCRRARKVIVA